MSTPLPRPPLGRRWLAFVAGLGLAIAGCSSGGHGAAHAAAPTTTTTVVAPGTVTVHPWSGPAAPAGAPTRAGFCTMLVALYQHMGELPHAASLSVSKQIAADYVTYEPKVVAAAPAAIRRPAGTYLTAVASYLTTMSAADFEMRNVHAGGLQALTQPSVTAAARTLLSYSEDDCHYTIGG